MDKILLALIAALTVPLYALSIPSAIPYSEPASTATAATPASDLNASNVGASDNWAGYIVGGGTFTEVGASWIIPESLSSTLQPLATDAAWVGIGGVTGRDLIQAGTETVVQDGYVDYEAWYETLPDEQHIIPLSIHSGDRVSVSLKETSAGVWQLSFKNETTGKQYEKEIAYDSSKTSAEWIEERPLVLVGDKAGYAPLNDFGTISFTGAYAVKDGMQESLSDLSPTPVSMVSGGLFPLALPSSVAHDGSFSVSKSDDVSAQSQSAPYHIESHRDYDYGSGYSVEYILGF